MPTPGQTSANGEPNIRQNCGWGHGALVGMKAIELFAGVGGFRLGLEPAGHQVIWANEWDRFAADVYDHNFGGKIDRRDLTTIKAGEVPAHDLMVGGFPCQTFSLAGNRRGFQDSRGTLFFEMARLAQHHRTPYLLLENVRGLLSHAEGWTFKAILSTLDELGYDCQWQILNSKSFGVPQSRDRVFIVANLRGRPRPAVFPLASGKGHDPSEVPERFPLSVVGHLAGVKNSQSSKVYCAEGISPTLNTSHPVKIQIGGKVRNLTPTEHERCQGFPDGWTKSSPSTQRYKQMGNAVTPAVIEAIARRLPLEA